MKILYAVFLISFIHLAVSQSRSFSFNIEMENSHRSLHLESAETLPCVGYGIHAKVSRNDDTVHIAILGYRRPVPCISGTDIAHERISLIGVKTETFVIKFRWQKNEDVWKVSASGKAFTAMPIRHSFTTFTK